MPTATPAKPKPSGKKAEPLTPAEQRRRFEDLSRELGTDQGETLDRVFGKIVPAKVKGRPVTERQKNERGKDS